MSTTTKRADMYRRIQDHGKKLLAIFPNAKEKEPVKLCKKLRRLEMQGEDIAIRLCNGPEFAEGELDSATDALLKKVNDLLGNVRTTPIAGPCSCRRGQQRDNCSNCEGTGKAIDWRRFHEQRKTPLVPIFLNRDPRGYALKIDDTAAAVLDIYKDWGGYGIIAPDLG